MTPRKPPPLGLLLLAVALGAGVAGYLLGRIEGGDETVARGPAPGAARPAPLAADPWAEALGSLDGEPAAVEEPVPEEPAPAAADAGESGLTFAERMDRIRRLGDSPRGQAVLVGLVAEAAARGGEMLPEISAMLDEGWDVKFSSWDGKGPGWPSLRVALLAAAEATGDPHAGDLIATVARTTESPVELVFSAHLLQQLDRLDPETARRTFDSLGGQLTAEEKRAMAGIVGKVIPAVARANPEYAEYFVTTQLRATEGPRADPRLLAPAIDGLPPDRARTLVLDSMMAGDVADNVKRMLGSRAAATGDVATLRGLQDVLATHTLDVRTTSTIARGAMAPNGFGALEKQARHALKEGDLARAGAVASAFEERLAEARRTVRAAGDAGARIPGELAKRDSIYWERLGGLRAQIERERRRLEQAAAAR